jgi:hypothetical protein
MVNWKIPWQLEAGMDGNQGDVFFDDAAEEEEEEEDRNKVEDGDKFC